MSKKGKYKILSYFVDGDLIFYKSLNKNKVFIGFSIFYFNSIYSILPDMNYFLKKRLMNYYSLQIDLNKRKFILICFEDTNKNKILKCHSIIYENLLKKNDSITFLKGKELENYFFNLTNESLNLNEIKKENDGSLSINNKETDIQIKYYKIKFDCISKKELFLDTFTSLTKNFNENMGIIFNFKIDRNNKIIFFPFIIEIQNKRNNHPNLDYNINTFFNNNMLEKKNLRINDIGLLLWRLPIDNEFFYLLDFTETFYLYKKYNLDDLTEFMYQIKDDLNNNEIEFTKINDDMLLINQKILFVLIIKQNLEFIKKIIKKFYDKYNIYLVYCNNAEYEKIAKIEELSSLNKIKIFNKNQFFEQNINIFRDKL